MDVPQYLRILWAAKWLLLVGVIVAVVAALFAGYTVENGRLVPRTPPVYQAATTILVGSANQPLFQSELPGQTVEAGETAPQARDLTQTAVVYAYLVSGSEIRARVEERIGAFDSTESLTAVRRTTQPGGDESSPGRFSLPILDIGGVSSSPERAEEISRTANEVFQDYVLTEQSQSGIPASSRVEISTIDEGAAVDVSKSSSVLPLVATGIGVFLLFVVAAFVMWNIRESRARSRAVRHAGRRTSEPTPIDPRRNPSAVAANVAEMH